MPGASPLRSSPTPAPAPVAVPAMSGGTAVAASVCRGRSAGGSSSGVVPRPGAGRRGRRLGAQPRRRAGRGRARGPPAAVDEVVAWCRRETRRAASTPSRWSTRRPSASRASACGRRFHGSVPAERDPRGYDPTAPIVLLSSAKESLPGVPQVADPARLQVVRREDRARVRAGCDGRRGAERLGQVEPRRRSCLGARGAGPARLRGGRMDDVIFAGTPERSALGRSEVSLTIDNTAHLLPIEFTEVTITRTLFRDGESEYQINGSPAGCSTSRSCCPTRASAASSTSSSARVSSTRC